MKIIREFQQAQRVINDGHRFLADIAEYAAMKGIGFDAACKVAQESFMTVFREIRGVQS